MNKGDPAVTPSTVERLDASVAWHECAEFDRAAWLNLPTRAEMERQNPGVTRLTQEWTPSEKDRKLHELAKRYHDETEAFDRTVCTGPIIEGSIRPVGYRELAQINRNADEVRRRIFEEAERHDIGRDEMRRAIGRFA
jgi:hypothetical protein